MTCLEDYRQVWLVDFEFGAPPGDRPTPLCCVAREYHSDRLHRMWLEDGTFPNPPYPTDEEVLLVAYYASAELGCHLVLDWPMPTRILDLYAEFRWRTSGHTVPNGKGLLGALTFYGLDALECAQKDRMRQLALRGGPYTPYEREALMDYCQSDVDSLARLLPRMMLAIDLPRALLRGRYTAAVARMEHTGIPIDVESWRRLQQNWDMIKSRLIARVDAEYGVFVPSHQRTVDPQTRLGAILHEEAKSWEIDVSLLSEAVDAMWKEERESLRELQEAVHFARMESGLTRGRIESWENAGKDHSTYPGLDAKARELAGRFPILGIGSGYLEEGIDDLDSAQELWNRLREPDPSSRSKHDPDLVRAAAEQVAASPPPSSYGGPLSFSSERWANYLEREGIAWPRLPSGTLALDEQTFREMARAYPRQVGPIREIRSSLSQLRLNELAVGSDGRNRTLLSPFSSRTGRNQPSNTKFVFGPAVWLRALIQPSPGRAVAYVDWSQQELAIAAALSGDARMQEAYVSGDFYLTFAKMASAVPPGATKQSHGQVRDQFKTVALGVLYGLGAEGLARKLSVPPCQGRELLQMHQRTFKTFWQWSDRVEMQGMLTGKLCTTFGWQVYVGVNSNPRSLRNFPMQAHGAEMMRLACCLATEGGISVCAPIHDALLVEGSLEEIDDVVERTQAAMQEASTLVLPGFPLRTDAKVIRWPDRYLDERGVAMWEMIQELLEEFDGEVQQQDECAFDSFTPTVEDRGPRSSEPGSIW